MGEAARVLLLAGGAGLWSAMAVTPQQPVLNWPSAGKADVAQVKANVAWFMALPEERLLAMVPDRSGFLFVGCPNCTAGSQENQLTLRLDDPDHVVCRFCGERYPSERYPDTQVLRVTNPVGREVEYPYWENREGYRFFFQARKWYLQREYLAQAALDMATVAHHTGEADYARRAALILDAFARVYPGYCVTNDYPGRQKSLHPSNQPPYPYWGGKWSRWFYEDVPVGLIRAYDLLRPMGVLEQISRERGEPKQASRRRIEDDLIRGSIAFVRAYPVYQGNMDPLIHTGLIAAGRVLPEPEYVHEAVKRISDLFVSQFFFDGAWREGTTSYHNQTVGGLMGAIRLLEGYSDPEGYRHPQTGQRFDNLDLAARFPIIEKASRFSALMSYPNGRTVPVHDAWAREQVAPSNESGPMPWPALGHVRLGRGRGPDQVQAHLHFAGGYGHQHLDLLGITLYGAGRELLSDIGYTHTRYRAWSTCTLAHNTVVVDGKDQAPGGEKAPNDGALRMFAALPWLQAAEAEAPRAYPGVTSEYGRLLVLVDLAPDACYLLDVFRVAGGSRHELAYHGDADSDSTLQTPLELTPVGPTLLPPGVTLRPPRDEADAGEAGGHYPAYGFVTDVHRADASQGWQVTFRTDEALASVRLHGLPLPGTTLFTGTAPSLRRARDDDAQVDRYRMPMVVLRREGSALASEFVVVAEAFRSHPVVQEVEMVPTSGAPGDVAVRVHAGEVTDTILVRAGDHAVPLKAGGVELSGRLGIVRERAGRTERLALVGGTFVRKGRHVLRGPGVLSGVVVATRRRQAGDAVDGLVVVGDLRRGSAIRVQTLVVTHGDGFRHGYRVRSVRAFAEREAREGRREERRWLVELEDDPGFRLGGEGNGELLFFPRRKWKGPDRFEVAPAVERSLIQVRPGRRG